MILILSLFVVYLLYYIVTRKYNYWKNKNVPHPKPIPLFGNYSNVFLLKKDYNQTVNDICQQFPDEPMVGAYFGTEPVLIPKDPELIKLIAAKDFYYFNGRELSDHSHREPTDLNVFASHGDTWKVLRQNLTPLFSSAKMKNMFHLIEKRTHTLEKLLEEEFGQSGTTQVKTLMARFMIESIGACVFGVDADTMGKNEKNPFKRAGLDLSVVSKPLAIKRNIRSVWPRIFYGLRIPLLTDELNVFSKVVASVFEERNNKPTSRNDFIDLLLKWKENNHISGDGMRAKHGEVKKKMMETSDELLFAQCLVFFAAGFETSASTSGFTLYELAKNESVMEKVLAEVDAYLLKNNNKITYECVTELPYLEACIDEALRLYPVLGVITREVMDDYTLPNGVSLEKGIRVHLPVYHMQRNPKYFPDPEEFRPERFFGEEKRNVIPYTYMPFGEGPRICMGMRFAKMQMMAGLVTILKTYRLELDRSTPRKLAFRPESFITTPTEDLKVRFVKREGWEKRLLAD